MCISKNYVCIYIYYVLLYMIIANITNQGFHSALHHFPPLGGSRWRSIELSVVTKRACVVTVGTAGDVLLERAMNKTHPNKIMKLSLITKQQQTKQSRKHRKNCPTHQNPTFCEP